MSEGLRTEDVKEALGYIDWIASVAADWPDVDENYAIVAAAARDHLQCLASQEQTPETIVIRREDGRIPNEGLAAAAEVLRQKLSRNGFKMKDAQVRAGHWISDIIIAYFDALVGFHPQPTEEEK